MDDGIGMDENQVRQMPRRMRLVKKSDNSMSPMEYRKTFREDKA